MTIEQKVTDMIVQNLIEAGVPTFQDRKPPFRGGGLVTASAERDEKEIPAYLSRGEGFIVVKNREDIQAVIESLKRKNDEARPGDGVTINVVCRN